MNQVVASCLENVELGEGMCWSNVALMPLMAADREPLYHTMAKAMEDGSVRIVEVSAFGSVPELKVIHTGSLPVLLLDGEEVEGAKQNRVINTTLLIPGGTELNIPVSCTEQGRWADVSAEFSDSGVVLERKTRARKAAAVAASLEHGRSYAGNQGEVWSSIDQLHADLGSNSPTLAMKDAYRARSRDLHEALEALPSLEGQHGFVAVINGEAVGLDLLSLENAYSGLHKRLLKSYLVDALSRHKAEPASRSQAEEVAAAFLEEIKAARSEEHPSPGLGTDVRIRGPRLVGSSLVHEGTAVHLGAFRLEEGGRLSEQPMAAMRHRRSMYLRRDF